MLQRALLLAILAVLVVQLPVEAAGIQVARSGPRSSGGVALTFDDGWGVSSCESIARTLRRAGVTATFFINGTHLARQPARWRRILGDFPVANHTRTHPDLARASALEIRRQLKSTERIHMRVLGRPLLKILRPPYGAYDQQVVQVAGSMAYRYVVLWSHSSGDTSSAATVSSITRNASRGGRGSIILMHCARSLTAQALPAIIRNYKRRGIPMIGLDEMFGMGVPRPQRVEAADPWKSMEEPFEQYARQSR